MDTEKDLKNEFRDQLEAQQALADPVAAETEKVGEAEMLRRDTFAAMRNFQVMEVVTIMDGAHSQAAINVYDDFIAELRALPISEASASLIEGIAGQVLLLEKGLKKSVMSRANTVILSALEAAVSIEDDAGSVKPAEPGSEAVDGELEETLEASSGDAQETAPEFADEADTSLDDEPDPNDNPEGV